MSTDPPRCPFAFMVASLPGMPAEVRCRAALVTFLGECTGDLDATAYAMLTASEKKSVYAFHLRLAADIDNAFRHDPAGTMALLMSWMPRRADQIETIAALYKA